MSVFLFFFVVAFATICHAHIYFQMFDKNLKNVCTVEEDYSNHTKSSVLTHSRCYLLYFIFIFAMTSAPHLDIC